MDGLFLDGARIARERARGYWPDRVITDYLDRWVAEKPDATALIAYRSEERSTTVLTYRELAIRSARTARALTRAGVRKGDVVAFQLPNWWEFIAIHLACVRLGAISNPLMPIFRQRELSFMLRHGDASVLIVPDRFRGFDHGTLALQLARDLPNLRKVLIVGGDGASAFDAALADGADHDDGSGAALAPNDVMQLLYTSGTTGEPKGALHTSNTLFSAILQFPPRMGLNNSDVVFMPSPLAHQLGFCYGMMMPLALGIPLVMTDIWQPAMAIDLIERHGATFMFAATPFLADLADLPEIAQHHVGRLRMMASSGAPIPPAVAEIAHDRLGVVVAPSWGMTECASVTITPPDGYKVLESDGCALPHAEVRIVDSDGIEVPHGDTGTLQVRGSSLFVGYLKRPQLYHVDADGWFDTGDLARMDAEGYIRICGRSKDVIIRGGENIPVVEIESTLYRMPQIAEVAIVAMPDPRLQERACAFVTLHAGTSLTFAEMTNFLTAEGVTKHFWPERLEILPEMPRTPTGKIQKFMLREMAKQLAPRADPVASAAH